MISIKDYEKLTATKTLFSELKKGEDSAKEKGWLSTKEVCSFVCYFFLFSNAKVSKYAA